MTVTLRIYTGPGTASELPAKLAAMNAANPAMAQRWFVRERRPVPLGDVVERFAKPIAQSIDSATADISPLLGFGNRYATRLAAGCGPCSKKRQVLNQVVRDVRDLREWRTLPRRIKAILAMNRIKVPPQTISP